MASLFANHQDARANLCETCSELFTGDWIPEPDNVVYCNDADLEAASLFDRPIYGRMEAGKFAIRRHHDIQTLRRIASVGCRLCIMLYDHIRDFEYTRYEKWTRVVTLQAVTRSSKTWEVETEGINKDGTLILQFRTVSWGESAMESRITCSPDIWHENCNKFDEADVQTVFPSIKHAEHAFSHVPSDQTIRQIQQWAMTCRADHEGCQALSNPSISADPMPFMPTRVLDVAPLNSSSLQLRKGVDIGYDREYVTLSHCWGGMLPSRLTVATYADAFVAIPEDDLPLTFRHAIAFARSLNVRYLWIDALCIIQDLHEDWAKESTQMAEVYSHAFLSIAATASSDSHGGLFRQENRDLFAPCLINATWSGYRPGRYLCTDNWAFQRRVLGGPLNQRAWAFQERILAPRIVHFARDQIWWQCRDHVRSEFFHPEAPYRLLCVNKPIANKLINVHQSTAEEANRIWLDIVGEYSGSALTYASDRLVALAGVASRLGQIMDWDPNSYVAGLWTHDLPTNLLWHMLDLTGTRQNDEYVAPSWSWASVTGEVNFFGGSKPNSRNSMCVDLESINVYYEHTSFGRVRRGTLCLRGEVQLVSLSGPWVSGSVAGHDLLTFADGCELAYGVDDFIDILDESAIYSNQESTGGVVQAVWCIIRRIAGDREDTISEDGLLLRPLIADGGVGKTYERIGVLTVTRTKGLPRCCHGQSDVPGRQLITIE